MPAIRVVTRFRPINTREENESKANGWIGEASCPIWVDREHLLQYNEKENADRVGTDVECKQSEEYTNTFEFDNILVWVNQEMVFREVGLPVVLDALQGINGTIFTFGASGSGKTFTMFGPEPSTENNAELLGIVPRSCSHLFTSLAADPTVASFQLEMEFFEIYSDNEIRDLLHPGKKGDKPLRVRDGRNGIFVEGLRSEPARNLTEALQMIAIAHSHFTESSSPSNTIMKIFLTITHTYGSRSRATLTFCDLAGSDKVVKTSADAIRINQSRAPLGNVVSKLAQVGSGKKTLVPFRDSALTHALKDSLAGNCKTTLIIAASPHKCNIVQTVNSFRFGSRCKLIKTKAKVNRELTKGQMMKRVRDLEARKKALEIQLAAGGGGGRYDANGVPICFGTGFKIVWKRNVSPNDGAMYKSFLNSLRRQITLKIQQFVHDAEKINFTVQLSRPGKTRVAVVIFSPIIGDNDESEEDSIETTKRLRDQICEAVERAPKKVLKGHTSVEPFDSGNLVNPQEFTKKQMMKMMRDLEFKEKMQAQAGPRYKFDDSQTLTGTMSRSGVESMTEGSDLVFAAKFTQLFQDLDKDDDGFITYEEFISIGDRIRNEDTTDKTFINNIKSALDGAIRYLQVESGAADSNELEWKQKKMEYEKFLRLLHPKYSDEINTLQFIGNGRHVDNCFDRSLSFDTRMDYLVGLNGDDHASSFFGLLADYVKQSKSHVQVGSFKSKGKKIGMSLWNSFRRTTAFADFFTDIRLLYLVSNAGLLPLTVILSLSIICPYIISYSCGVKLLFINQHRNSNDSNNNNNSLQYMALKRILWYLGISPVGIFYFVLLDFIDILFNYYKLIMVLLLGKSDFEMKLLEETMANQLGMSRMDYEGIKRQRTAAMLLFETLPQAIVQGLLMAQVFYDRSLLDDANIQESDVYISIISAALNATVQVLRLQSESRACNETFYKYCVSCLMARISWIPFVNDIEKYLTGGGGSDSDRAFKKPPAKDLSIATQVVRSRGGSEDESRDEHEPQCHVINYKIKCEYPFGISKLIDHKHQMAFDFSPLTIHELISTFDLSKKKRRKHDNKHKQEHRRGLRINFGKSLRLLPFMDLMDLFDACIKHDIMIEGMNKDDICKLISNGIDISQQNGNDVRLLSNCKNVFGKPYAACIPSICKIMDCKTTTTITATATSQNDLEYSLLETFIDRDFDMNVCDKTNGETVIYDLIRSNNLENYLLLLNKFVKEKKNRLLINYHNYSGESPLFVAIKQYVALKQEYQHNYSNYKNKSDQYNRNNGKLGYEKQQEQQKRVESEMCKVMMENNIENASLNFPAFEREDMVRSCLGYVVFSEEWDMVPLMLKNGAILNSRETSSLPSTYFEMACDSRMHNIIDNQLKRVVEKCDVNLKHLCDKEGNNAFHILFARLNGVDNSSSDVNVYEKYEIGFKKLIQVCCDWMFMENDEGKLPIEYAISSLYRVQAVEFDGVEFKKGRAEMINRLLEMFDQSKWKMYKKLINYRLKENKLFVNNLRRALMVGFATKELNSGDDIALQLWRTLKDILFDESVNWVKTLGNVNLCSEILLDRNSFVHFVFDAFGNDISFDDKEIDVHGNRIGNDDKKSDEKDEEKLDVVNEHKKDDNKDNVKLESDSSDDEDDNKDDEFGLQTTVDIGDNYNKDAKNKQIKNEMNSEPLSWFDWVYVLSVECLSTADLITDIFILEQLILSREQHQWWAAFSLLFMISPYLVSYTAIGTMLHKRSSVLSVFVMITPLCIFYFAILDVIFMCYALISSLIFFVSFTRVNIGNWMENEFFYRYLGMSRMELCGYRRLRTLAQLLFETFPSLILQIRMLVVLSDDDELDVSLESIYLSMGFAIIHTLMEGTILYLDSKACKISLEQYAMICLNARQSWVPYANILANIGNSQESNVQVLDFEHIISYVCNLGYKLDFEFCHESWQILIKYVNQMPSISPALSNDETYNLLELKNTENTENETEITSIEADNLLAPLFCDSITTMGMNDDIKLSLQQWTPMKIKKIYLGNQCCKNIDIVDLFQLYRGSSNKILLECGDINWSRVIKTSFGKFGIKKSLTTIERLITSMIQMGDFNSLKELKHGLYCALNTFATGTVFNLNENSMKNHDLTLSNVFSDSMKHSMLSFSKFNILPLKQCYDQGIKYGLNCYESNILYTMVYHLLQSNLLDTHSDDIKARQHFYTAMLMLWYSQGTIDNHHCYECNKNWIQHIVEFEQNYARRKMKNRREYFDRDYFIQQRTKFRLRQSCREYLPSKIEFAIGRLGIASEHERNEMEEMNKLSVSTFAGTESCNVINRLFGQYLLSKLFSYSLVLMNSGAAQMSSTGNGALLESKLKDNRFVLQIDGNLAEMKAKVNDISNLNKSCFYLEGNFDTHLMNVKTQEIFLNSKKVNENEIIARKYTLEFSPFFQDEPRDEYCKIFVGQIEVELSLGDERKDNDQLDHIAAYLYLPTIKWDKNDFIFTKIPLQEQPVNLDVGIKFVWKLKRLYGFKFDMRDAKLDINIFAHDSNSLYPFNDEIKCNISWQTIYIHK